jgi:hypothetical protein
VGLTIDHPLHRPAGCSGAMLLGMEVNGALVRYHPRVMYVSVLDVCVGKTSQIA